MTNFRVWPYPVSHASPRFSALPICYAELNDRLRARSGPLIVGFRFPCLIERLRGTLRDITLADRVAVIYEGGAKVYIEDEYPPDSLEEHMSVIEHRIDRPNYGIPPAVRTPPLGAF